MAVGYHKINSSAARSKIKAGKSESGSVAVGQVKCRQSGSKIWSASYGWGVCMEDFVSDSDKVRCQYESGYTVVHTGVAVRNMMKGAIDAGADA